ncbi:MAG: glycoside hydrolase family 130 protein [Chitinophagaceae bacterium]
MKNQVRALSFHLVFLVGAAGCIFSCNEVTQKVAEIEKAGDSLQTDENDWALLPFTKVDLVNPIMGPGKGTFFCPILKKKIYWEDKDVFNPAVIVRDGKVFMLYRAEDKIGKFAGTSRIGLAESTDGLHFTRHPEPVFFPDNDAQKKYEWEGGCEDPRVVQDSNGTYYMTYTSYDGKLARLMVASSNDIRKWKKHGPAFATSQGGKYLDKWSKSGSIISTYQNGKITATKINGKYWMYWGDVHIWVATSEDLVKWTPVEMETGEKPAGELKYQAATIPDLKIILATRKGKFDSDILEPGPPAMLTDNGILLIYNSRNIPSIGDTALVEGTYTASQVLLDKTDPTRVLHRMDNYFMKPDRDFEIKGQVNQVCFVEGLVEFGNKWLLYYGTADSKIAVAERNKP